MISATLDSSVLVRALHLGSRSAIAILGAARTGKIRMDVSEPIIGETLRVLRDRFDWNGDMIHQTRGTLIGIGNMVTPVEALDVIKEDPDDNRILECAAAAKSDFIVSEDKDLLRQVSFATARIVNISDFPAQVIHAPKHGAGVER